MTRGKIGAGPNGNGHRSIGYALTPTPGNHNGKVKPILITGGAGFIGSNLAHRPLSAGHRVRLLDNLSRTGVERNLQWLIETHGDLVDTKEDFEINARGTLNLLEAIRTAPNPPTLIFTSTNKVYGTLADLEFTKQA